MSIKREGKFIYELVLNLNETRKRIFITKLISDR